MDIRVALIASFLMTLLAVPSAAGPVVPALKVVTENYPPFNFSDEEGKTIVGISVDTVREMGRRAKIDVGFGMFPWSRALLMAERNADTCVMSTFRTKEREGSYQWVGPIVSDNLVFFALAENQIKLKTIDDVRHYTVGTYLGSGTIPMLEQQNIKYDIAPNDALNLKKLQAKRIDLWIASEKTGFFTALQEGIKVRKVLNFGESTDMYLACNKNMPAPVVHEFNKLLERMKLDGSLEAIEKKYR